MQADVEELKRKKVSVEFHLKDIESALNDIQNDLKDIRAEMQKQIKQLFYQMERKTGKTNSKLDLAVYFFIVGLLSLGGFDYWVKHGKMSHHEREEVSILSQPLQLVDSSTRGRHKAFEHTKVAYPQKILQNW